MIEMFTDVECLDELGGFLGILFFVFLLPIYKDGIIRAWFSSARYTLLWQYAVFHTFLRFTT